MLRTPESGPGTARPRAPRVLWVRIPEAGPPRVERVRFEPGPGALDRLARRGGSALAAAWLFDWTRGRSEPVREPVPLVLAVGEAVRRGLPTAARLAVASRSPLTNRYADGQVGGDLARRLAPLGDALVLEGAPPREPGAARCALVVGPPSEAGGLPEVELAPADGLVGLAPGEVHAALSARFGDLATLCVGPTALAGSPLASLVARDGVARGDTEHAHFVGRGGLGLALAHTGLVALGLRPPAEAPGGGGRDPGAVELARLLLRSPRLAARAAGGTLELFDDLAARGEAAEREAARALARELEAAPGERHGCRGCPTPCGVVLASGDGAVGARFGALKALGLELGLDALDDALALQAACNRIGADAKELGAALALLAEARAAGRAPAGPALRGRRAALLAAVSSVAPPGGGGPVGDGELLSGGVRELARRLGRGGRGRPGDPPEDAAGVPPPGGGAYAGGGALERGRALASLLGQCAAARGADPMRSFPFLASDTVSEQELAQRMRLPIPPGTLDPRRPEGKGRLVFWHENLALALDAAGFCAFSAAALLADGVASLEQLARALAGLGAGDFLALGEQLARLVRRLDLALAGPGAQGIPAALAGRLDRPGLWPEYARLRGLDRGGDPTEALVDDFEAERATDPVARLAARDVRWGPSGDRGANGDRDGGGGAVPDAESDWTGPPSRPPEREPGRVVLRSGGPLAAALGRELALELELPSGLEEVLGRAARERPAAAELLASPGPVVYRRGERLDPGSPVRDGDVLELLLVISGGAL